MMNELQMFTQEEVAEILHANIATITTLRELGILKAIRTGRNFMFSVAELKSFQQNYAGYDVSNRVKALEAARAVKSRLGEY